VSRIGKQPVAVPAGVDVKIADGWITVKGPKGPPDGLKLAYHRQMKVEYDPAQQRITVSRPNDDRLSRALHGLTRTLVANMVEGVTKGFEKKLWVIGIGYQAKLEPDEKEIAKMSPEQKKALKRDLVLLVGFATPVRVRPPEGITVDVGPPPPAVGDIKNPGATIIIRGADKQLVGQFAAQIRARRKPEPYQGKGIWYENEKVRRKEGKAFGTGG